jgi:F0F1-type ATP synthase membrane subunit b/b'
MRYGLVNFDDVSQQIEAAVAEAEAEHKDADPVVGLHYAQDNTNAPHMAFSALKFLFVYTLIVSVVFWPPVQSVVERRSFSCGEALS